MVLVADEQSNRKAELVATIEKATELTESEYTADSWAKLKSALESVNAVNDDEKSTYEQMAEATNALTKVLSELKRGLFGTAIVLKKKKRD